MIIGATIINDLLSNDVMMDKIVAALDLHQIVDSQMHQRHIPSYGLNYVNISYALKAFGFLQFKASAFDNLQSF